MTARNYPNKITLANMIQKTDSKKKEEKSNKLNDVE